jgi:hypothetical protein
MTKYNFDFQELEIRAVQIEKAMGYKLGNSPDPFPELIREVLDVAGNYCFIQGGYLIQDNISFDTQNKTMKINSDSFHIRKIVLSQIKNSEKVAFFLCTAGPDIGEWSKKLMSEGEMIRGYVVDVVGSEVVETAMDKIQNLLKEEMINKGFYITNRYSPGYCRWNISEQQKLFKFFPENFCGIRLSDTSLMYPVKSVSGVIGIGKNVRLNNYPCKICDDKDCIYRGRR